MLYFHCLNATIHIMYLNLVKNPFDTAEKLDFFFDLWKMTFKPKTDIDPRD